MRRRRAYSHAVANPYGDPSAHAVTYPYGDLSAQAVTYPYGDPSAQGSPGSPIYNRQGGPSWR